MDCAMHFVLARILIFLGFFFFNILYIMHTNVSVGRRLWQAMVEPLQ